MYDSLDSEKIYIDYFFKKRDVICEVISYYHSKNKQIALWGAGKKGKAFLEAIDPDCTGINYIFDKDANKIGMRLSTGHNIEDYRIRPVDVVFVANSVFELDVIHALGEYFPQTRVINIDNIVLGDLSANDVLHPQQFILEKVKENKICAVVVLYNPDLNVFSNISSYANELDWIYIYDNSIVNDADILEKLKEIPNSTIIRKNDNYGLSVAFNEVSEIARKRGFTWMITFDQDSIATDGMIDTMREYVNSSKCDDKVAIVAPVVNDIDNREDTPKVYCSYFDKVIQSGAMHNLDILVKIGKYDEGLFIDEVDNEYCTRCIVHGYKIVKLNHALLMHNQQDDNVKKLFAEGTRVYINKYSPERYYYIYRNALYCYDKYKESYPLYALDCKNAIRKLKVWVQYDVKPEEKIEAMRQAQSDYENGIMGKIKGK